MFPLPIVPNNILHCWAVEFAIFNEFLWVAFGQCEWYYFKKSTTKCLGCKSFWTFAFLELLLQLKTFYSNYHIWIKFFCGNPIHNLLLEEKIKGFNLNSNSIYLTCYRIIWPVSLWFSLRSKCVIFTLIVFTFRIFFWLGNVVLKYVCWLSKIIYPK